MSWLNRRSLIFFGILVVVVLGLRLVFPTGYLSPTPLPSVPVAVPYTPPPRPIIEHRAECAQRVIEKYEFASDFVPFPGERCSTRFNYPAGACAVFKSSADGVVQGPYGDCVGSKSPQIPTDAKFAKSIGKPFSVQLTVDQPVSSR